MSTKKAATLLGLPEQTLRVFLQYGRFKEFAEAIKKEGSKHWTYYINEQVFLFLELYDYLKIKKPVQTAI